MKKEKLFDNPIEDKPHPLVKEGGSGFQKIYRFSNGYGASVVRFKLMGGRYGSYTDNETEFELAVLKFNSKNNKDFKLVYDTPITEDVVGHLTEDGVEEKLQAIKVLD